MVPDNALWQYEYNLTDHLGNVRAVFAVNQQGTAELRQKTDYYPFGMVMNQTNEYCRSCPPNKFLYNGKSERSGDPDPSGELQDDVIAGTKLDWYDYGARMYDAAIGRWHVVDPLADQRSWVSPYGYCQNSPMNRVDPTGALDHEWLYNTVTGDMTWQSDLGGNEVQFVIFATPFVEGGMLYEGTAVIEGSNVYAGPIRSGWGASSADYWSGIPENYNVNSIDYVKGGNYEYSRLDLRKRYQVFNNPKLSGYQRTIAKSEASGNAQPIHGIEYRNQYTAKWETDKSFWFGIEAGFWNPADVGTMLDDGLKYLKNFRQTQRTFKYTSMWPALSPGKVSGNPWNQFLKETRGTYSGTDWLRKASDDYKLWKQAKGL